jgi:hypothetical protein
VGGVDELHRLLDSDRVGQPTAIRVLRRTQSPDFAIMPVEMAAR